MTQKERVRQYLEKNKTINSFECFINLQIVDLQKAIQLLRKEGYPIKDRWIKKNNTQGRIIKYKEYRLED